MKVREEITVWDKAPNTPNHIYITEGTQLLGYIPRGTTKAIYFKTPMKTWAVTRRKFRNITSKKELAMYEL